jgi:hypothetical protein
MRNIERWGWSGVNINIRHPLLHICVLKYMRKLFSLSILGRSQTVRQRF